NGCISQISKCKEINNSKCSKCSFWYSPIKYGTLCESRAVWSVIIVAFFVCSYCFDSIIVSLVVVTKNIFNKLHTHKIVKTTTLFAMNISNINFVSFQSGVCVSSTVIDLNSDTEQIEVNKETSQVLCVGNTNKNSTKKQFTISSNITKFTIRVDPEVVTLKYDFACEFSVFVTPLCSCNIDNNIQLISKNLKINKEKYNEIIFVGVTQQSTRIDYNELSVEKKLNEGSFGVVYKGEFRRNVVAIKKVKILRMKCQCLTSSSVSILFIFMELFLYQIMCNISYLHKNEILHRDIKPDNILIISCDTNYKVNAKLTDFGSSRNVNMLMTNMIFTKGVGTPKYMAPEILNRKKYTKSADIYSFGLSVFECITWIEAYLKKQFKFAWDIVDFVVNGKRPNKPSNLNDNTYTIVNDM
ncbi:protein serine/threonine kinase, putative, partial [Entamoeba invadens IP1]